MSARVGTRNPQPVPTRAIIEVLTGSRNTAEEIMDQSDLKAPTWQLSERARKLTSSAIREILKVTERPEVISFAGGLPAPSTFPAERMRAASDRILRDTPAAALQYSATEGYLPLREWIAARHSGAGANGNVQIRPTPVLITTGSAQALSPP